MAFKSVNKLVDDIYKPVVIMFVCICAFVCENGDEGVGYWARALGLTRIESLPVPGRTERLLTEFVMLCGRVKLVTNHK